MCIRQTYAPASAIDARELGIAAQRGDVVDEQRAELERPARHLGLRGVDRDRKPCEPLEDRHDPPQLLVERDRVRARAGRLAADIDERRPSLEQPLRGRDSSRRIEVLASVGEAVRA